MVFGASSIITATLIIGCGATLPFFFGEGNKQFHWNQNISVKSPVLDCKNTKSHYQAFIGLENTKRQPVLKIVDAKIGKEVDWAGAWRQLRIFDSGEISIEELDGRNMGNYDPEELKCEESKFQVNSWMYDNRHWERDITSIKMKLSEGCSEEKECDIQIEEGLGLGWKKDFSPKVIF